MKSIRLLAFGVLLSFVILFLFSHYVFASEVEEESSLDYQEEITEELTGELTEEKVPEVADEQLLSFGFLEEPEEESVTLARIYNLLLCMFYFLIINEGRKIIMRNLRKGHLKNGLAE